MVEEHRKIRQGDAVEHGWFLVMHRICAGGVCIICKAVVGPDWSDICDPHEMDRCENYPYKEHPNGTDINADRYAHSHIPLRGKTGAYNTRLGGSGCKRFFL